jgi:excisionase family DNA binding protein
MDTLLFNRYKAARFLGLHKDELDRLISRGHIRAVIVNGKPLVHRAEMHRFVNNLIG